MSRVIMNRWALVLALGVLLFCAGLPGSPARGSENPMLTGDPYSNPDWSGDPDVPTGPSGLPVASGQRSPKGRMEPVQLRGDLGGSTRSVLMERLIVVLHGLRAWYFRY